MKLLAVIILALVSLGAGQNVEVKPKSTNPPGEYVSADVAVPEGMHTVWAVIDRSEFTQANSRVKLRIEAQVEGVWRIIVDTVETPGGTRTRPGGGPLTESYVFVSLPIGATHARTIINVSGGPGTFGAAMRFTE